MTSPVGRSDGDAQPRPERVSCRSYIPPRPSIHPLDKKTHGVATTTNGNDDSLGLLADHLGSPQILHLTSDI